MNQTRTFLLFATVAVAYLLWNAWEKDYGPQPPVPATATTAGAASSAAAADGSVPGASAPTPAIPSATGGAAPAGQLVTVTTDLLRLTIDTRGGSLVRSELLNYPVTPRTKKNPDPAPIRLLDDSATHFFAAQDGLISANGPAPDHRALFQASATSYTLDKGQDALNVDLVWTDPSGVRVTKRYTVHRGSYVVDLSQQIDNGSAKPWTGNAYRQLQRVVPPPPVHSNFLEKFSDQSRYSFFGVAWPSQ